MLILMDTRFRRGWRVRPEDRRWGEGGGDSLNKKLYSTLSFAAHVVFRIPPGTVGGGGGGGGSNSPGNFMLQNRT